MSLPLLMFPVALAMAVGPPPEHRLTAGQVDTELPQAGWRKVSASDVLPFLFVRVYELAP